MNATSSYSEQALARQRELDEKLKRGETPTIVDYLGVIEPNPALPPCPFLHHVTGEPCLRRGNPHNGPHVAIVTWG